MLEWLTVISLILFGIAFVIIEIILIPGTTFVGIAGLIFIGVGLYMGFQYFGNATGYVLLASTVVVSLISVYVSFKTRLWERFSLKSVNEDRVNETAGLNLQVGDSGVAVSSLRPSGTGEFGDRLCEVRSMGGYIQAGNKIRIIKIESNKIFVEPVIK